MDVYLIDMNANPPKFQVCSCLQQAPNGPLVFHNNRRRGFDIYFRLHDENGSGYRFPQDENDAVWSQLGAACPNAAPVPPNQVFQPKRVQSNRRVLVVYNLNPQDPATGHGQGDFQYTLRVWNAAGQEKHLDPGGDNQNGQSN